MPAIKLERGEKARTRWITPEDATRLLETCRASRNPTLADLVEFCLFTGLRQSEALGLTWASVDRSRGVVRLADTKNGKPRDVQRGATLQEVKDLPGHSSLTMVLRYAHLAPEHLRGAVARLDDAIPRADAARLPQEEVSVS